MAVQQDRPRPARRPSPSSRAAPCRMLLGAGTGADIPQPGAATIRRFQRLVRSWKYRRRKARARKEPERAVLRAAAGDARALRQRSTPPAKAIRARTTAASPPPRRCSWTRWSPSCQGLAHSYIRLLNSAFHHREYLRGTNPDNITQGAGAAAEGARQRTCQGAGDQPQAHRDPQQARGEVREGPGELRGDRRAVRRRRGRAPADSRPVGDHARPAADQRPPRQPGARTSSRPRRPSAKWNRSSTCPRWPPPTWKPARSRAPASATEAPYRLPPEGPGAGITASSFTARNCASSRRLASCQV